jgi:hypothetical protein
MSYISLPVDSESCASVGRTAHSFSLVHFTRQNHFLPAQQNKSGDSKKRNSSFLPIFLFPFSALSLIERQALAAFDLFYIRQMQLRKSTFPLKYVKKEVEAV